MDSLPRGSTLRTERSKSEDCKGHRTNIPGTGNSMGKGPKAGRVKALGETMMIGAQKAENNTK